MNLLQITNVALTTAIDSTAMATTEVAEMNYWEMAKKGGPWIMIPLLILSIIAVYIFIERYVAIKKHQKKTKPSWIESKTISPKAN
jgi:biopolymer transport protein ExbB